MKIFISILTVLFFYFWTATAGYNNIFHDLTVHSKYNFLTKTFIQGHLYLPIEPSLEFKTLADPYNFKNNESFRKDGGGYQDFSYYNYKFYLYFGPSPVLTLYLPYRILTKVINNFIHLDDYKLFLPDSLAILIYVSGILIVSTLLLLHFKKVYFNETKEWMIITSIFVIGLSNFSGYLLRRPYIYEVTVAASSFFMLAAIYIFFLSLNNNKNKVLLLASGSLFLGLAVGTRINLIFSIVGLITFMIWLISDKLKLKNKIVTGQLIALTLPFIFCLAILALYNYQRFGNFFEFGFRYQIGPLGTTSNGLEIKRPMLSDSGRFFGNIYHYLFEPPVVLNDFPFLSTYLSSPDSFEKVVGVFTGIPFLLLIFLCPYLYARENLTKNQEIQYKSFPSNVFLMLLIPAFLNFFFLLFFRHATIRYSIDFLNLILPFTCALWFYFSLHIVNFKRVLNTSVLALSVISTIIGLALSITGPVPEQGLIIQNRNEYDKVEALFRPVSALLGLISQKK